MATILKVTAHFRRVVQPAQYESAEASLTIEAGFDEVEYQEGGAYKLLLETKANVLKALNIGGVVTEQTSTTTTEGAAAAEGAKKGPGRPKKDKDTASAATVSDEKPAATAAPEVKKIPDEDLQKAANKAAQTFSAAKVKEVMADFGVARLGEVPQEKRQEFLDKLSGLKKDTKDDEIPM